MTVLNRLVPFIFASVLESLALLRPDAQDRDDLILEDVSEYNKKAERENLEENENAGKPNSTTIDEKRSLTGKITFFMPPISNYYYLSHFQHWDFKNPLDCMN